jgi:CBS domain-containing protein
MFMLVRDVMNKNVIMSGPEITLREAARMMTDNRIGCLVIEKNSKLVGIITDRDILVAFAKNEIDPDRSQVEEIMTRYVIFTTPSAQLESAADTMNKNKVKKLPVIDNEKIVGIITSSDIALAEPDIARSLRKLMAKIKD